MDEAHGIRASKPPHAPRAIRGPRAGSGLRCAFALMLAVLAALCGPVGAAAENAAEANLKAAFVYNFTKFVEWPSESLVGVQNGVTLCVAGARPEIAAALAALAGKPVQGQALVVKSDVRAANLDSCHALFIGEDARALTDQARGHPGLLTVSDMPGFAESGGVIGLFSEGDRIRFAVNPQAAQRAGLKISSQLMKLAKVVGQ